MPINAGVEYQKAEYEYSKARTLSEKLEVLEKMLRTAPSHKGAEKLRKKIKQRISKLRSLQEKTQKQKKGHSFFIKKEGVAQIVLVGTVNSGKSELLTELTNAKPLKVDDVFVAKEPAVGILDYKGIKIQIIEIPAIIENFHKAVRSALYFSIIKQADLIILLFKTPEEKVFLDNKLKDINVKVLIYNNQENIKDEIWERLNLIKVYTKQPGAKPSYPPIALEKGDRVEEFAEQVHKDFIKKFRFARIWGKSVKFNGTAVSLNHVLEDEDVVELHLK